MTSAIGDINNSQLTQPVTPIADKKDEELGGSDFAALLRSFLPTQGSSKVSEEELFSALVKERVQSLKGDETAEKYDELFQKHKDANTRADGVISYEKATMAALKEAREAELLSAEESDSVYSSAFDAAQLDSNTSALFDNRGSATDNTIAVMSTEEALTLARARIEAFDSGEKSPGSRSLDGGDSASLSSVTPKGSVDSSNPVDGAEGFLWKPESESNGNLVVLLPKELTGDIESLFLKDKDDKEIERGQYSAVANGDREHFRFSKPGGSYPAGVVVEALLKDGSIKQYHIADPSQRYD